MNIFQCPFEQRLRSWKNIREIINGQPLVLAVQEVDRWWQQAPIQNHHLHPQDTHNWPDPWTMLSDNIYCPLTKAIGMCYTLLMVEITDIKLVEARDELGEDNHLVLVDSSKYVLNYHPDSVLSIKLNQFKLLRELPIDILKKHIK